MNSFIQLTFMTHDKLDGKKFYVHTEEIKRVIPHELYKDATPLIGEKPRKGSILKFPDCWTGVAETPEQVVELVNASIASWMHDENDMKLLLEDEYGHG